jgi:CheY-like chemotaxis protein
MEFNACPILQVEHEENDRFLLGRAFMSADIPHPVHVVKNGARAVSYLLGQPPFEPREYYPLPCLILLDLHMPCMTGLEFLNWRQTQPVLKRIPVLVLTTSRLARDVSAAYEAGANAYLVKPVSHEELVTMVKAIREFWLVQNTYSEADDDEVSPHPAASKIIPYERRNGHSGVMTPTASVSGAR